MCAIFKLNVNFLRLFPRVWKTWDMRNWNLLSIYLVRTLRARWGTICYATFSFRFRCWIYFICCFLYASDSYIFRIQTTTDIEVTLIYSTHDELHMKLRLNLQKILNCRTTGEFRAHHRMDYRSSRVLHLQVFKVISPITDSVGFLLRKVKTNCTLWQ